METLGHVFDILEAKKQDIEQRKTSFRETWESENSVFEELCFCLMTPQSKALHADKVLRSLLHGNLLYRGQPAELAARMNYIRFHHTKARRICKARSQFHNNGVISIKPHLEGKTIFNMREWLVQNINGFGYKEASHFLRNIGFGDDIAILDRHILRNLVSLGVIESVPKSISRKLYLEIEQKLQQFCSRHKITPIDLDLALWCKQTGFVFK